MITLLVWSWTDIVHLTLISHWPNNCAAFFISILYSLLGILKKITEADVSRDTCFLTLSDPDYPSAEMLSDVGDMVCCGEPWESRWSLIGILFFFMLFLSHGFGGRFGAMGIHYPFISIPYSLLNGVPRSC